MGTPHAPTATHLLGGEGNDTPNHDRHPDTAKSAGNVDDIVAGMSAVHLAAKTDSQIDTDTDTDAGSDTDSEVDAHDDDHVPEPATLRRWEVIDRIMDSLSSKLEAKIVQTKAEPAPTPPLLPKPAVLERRSSVEGSTVAAKGKRGVWTWAAGDESDEDETKERRGEKADEQVEMVMASMDGASNESSTLAAAAPPPPPGPTPEPLLTKGRKAGSSILGLFSRKQTIRSSVTDSTSGPSASESAPPQPPAPSSAPAARPLASAPPSLRTLAPAPPRATAAPTPEAPGHLGILGTLASALSAGGTQDVPAHLPHVVGEERDRIRDQLEDMFTRQTATTSATSTRGGPLFGGPTTSFVPAAYAHTRSAHVPPMPSQRGLVHTSMPTTPLSSRSAPQASHSTWQPPTATAPASGYGFSALGSGQGMPRQEFQVESQPRPTPTQDVGPNSGFRGLGVAGFSQPYINVHRNVALQEPTPPGHASTSPPSDLADVEDGEQQGRRRKSRVNHLKVDEEIASDHDGRRKKARKSDNLNTASAGQRKFACPYFKRNKKKYSKWTSCPGPGWDEVHRVKTHLYRRHALPIQCVRCWEVFKTDEALNAHLQQDPPCETRKNQTLVEGFTKDQEKRLRSRKKAQADTTDEDKWREIYMILFPYDEWQSIPSPFYEASDYEGEGGGTSGSGELEDYATFVQREMPTLVRRELETLFDLEFQDVEEPLRRRVAEIVVKLQPRLLNLYKQTQTPLSDYGPPSNEPSGGATGSEPGLTPTMSHRTPESDSTPGTNVEGSVPLGFDVDEIFDFDGILGVDQTQQLQQFDAYGNPVFNWDDDFEKLINPTFFMPPQLQGPNAGMALPTYPYPGELSGSGDTYPGGASSGGGYHVGASGTGGSYHGRGSGSGGPGVSGYQY